MQEAGWNAKRSTELTASGLGLLSELHTVSAHSFLRAERDRWYHEAIANSLNTIQSSKQHRQSLPTLAVSGRTDSLPAAALPRRRKKTTKAFLQEGTKLASMGMDHEACRRFMDGLERNPASLKLQRAFDSHLRRGKCSCRTAFSRPCPRPSPHAKGKKLRGTTWSCCPACGGLWADNPDKLERFTKSREEEIWQPAAEDDDGDGFSSEFRHVMASFNYRDLFPPEMRREMRPTSEAIGEMGRSRFPGDRERHQVELAAWKYFKDLKAMHAYYANLGGNSNDSQRIGSSAFVMDKPATKRFMTECKLFNDKLTKPDFDLVYIRVNWAGPDDGMDRDEKQRANNDPDTDTDLTVAEFIHMLLRCAKLRAPEESLSAAFAMMMDYCVMPHAQKDPMAFLRDVLEEDQKLRLFTYMFRKKLGLFFKRACVKTETSDPTPDGCMSLAMFSSALVACSVPLSLKDTALIFLQSQSEDFEEFEGDVDTDSERWAVAWESLRATLSSSAATSSALSSALPPFTQYFVSPSVSYDEFVEAVLRVGVKIAEPDSPLSIEDKYAAPSCALRMWTWTRWNPAVPRMPSERRGRCAPQPRC